MALWKKPMNSGQFEERGWCHIPHDPLLADWVAQVLPVARAAVADPAHAHWLRYGGTWFAGVNVLDPAQAPGGPPETSIATRAVRDQIGLPSAGWGPGQVSVCYPGYPQPMDGESEVAHRFRVRRDAAHVDGLKGEGPEKRRFLREHHAFLLGIPLVVADSDASPFVVWEGSHEVFRAAFATLLAGLPAAKWGNVDLTDVYKQTRTRIFETCRRVPLTARPGEAYLVHRLALHGMAPWAQGAHAGPDGRMIAYFRPELDDPADWLSAP